MAAPNNLKELYTADMRDLWSANDQMKKIVQAFSDKVSRASRCKFTDCRSSAEDTCIYPTSMYGKPSIRSCRTA